MTPDIYNLKGGHGKRRVWSQAAARLFSGTRDTNERHYAISRCTDLALLESIAADPTAGATYRKRCAARVRMLSGKGLTVTHS